MSHVFDMPLQLTMVIAVTDWSVTGVVYRILYRLWCESEVALFGSFKSIGQLHVFTNWCFADSILYRLHVQIVVTSPQIPIRAISGNSRSNLTLFCTVPQTCTIRRFDHHDFVS